MTTYLCPGCKRIAEIIAKGRDNPDVVRRKIGEFSELFGHPYVHHELLRFIWIRAGTHQGLDDFLDIDLRREKEAA